METSESFISEWYSSLSNDDKKDGTAQVKQETKEEVKSEDNKDEVDKLLEKDGEEAEDGEEKDKSDYYIVREQPNILQFGLKEYQLVVSN